MSIKCKLEHKFKFGDSVALIEIKDDRFERETAKIVMKIADYSRFKYNCYKPGDEQYQDEIGFVIKANDERNINQITVWFGQDRFVTVPWFCLNLEERTSKQLTRDPELHEDLIIALIRYDTLAAQ